MPKVSVGSMIVATALLIGACSSPGQANPLAGAWTISIASPLGEMAVNLDINPDLTGTMISDLGSWPLEDVMLSGELVSFETTIDAQGQVMTMVFKGSLTESGFSGAFDTDFGPISAAAVLR
ncbi:MAG: hypothetical protein WD406_08165 [Pseudohongiellaceae bacterium]